MVGVIKLMLNCHDVACSNVRKPVYIPEMSINLDLKKPDLMIWPGFDTFLIVMRLLNKFEHFPNLERTQN